MMRKIFTLNPWKEGEAWLEAVLQHRVALFTLLAISDERKITLMLSSDGTVLLTVTCLE